MNKLLLGALLLSLSSAALALRCNGKIIDETSNYNDVVTNCQIDNEYIVNKQNADIRKVYNEQGGMTHEILIIDGKVKEINSSRF